MIDARPFAARREMAPAATHDPRIRLRSTGVWVPLMPHEASPPPAAPARAASQSSSLMPAASRDGGVGSSANSAALAVMAALASRVWLQATRRAPKPDAFPASNGVARWRWFFRTFMLTVAYITILLVARVLLPGIPSVHPRLLCPWIGYCTHD